MAYVFVFVSLKTLLFKLYKKKFKHKSLMRPLILVQDKHVFAALGYTILEKHFSHQEHFLLRPSAF